MNIKEDVKVFEAELEYVVAKVHKAALAVGVAGEFCESLETARNLSEALKELKYAALVFKRWKA